MTRVFIGHQMKMTMDMIPTQTDLLLESRFSSETHGAKSLNREVSW